jgi:hypothetical protein
MLFHGSGNAQSDIIACCASANHIYWVYGLAAAAVLLWFGPVTLTGRTAPTPAPT